MAKKIGYAVVGLGIGQAHVDAAYANPDADLIAVCDLRQDRIDLAVKGHPEVKEYLDFDEMIKNPDIDIISICLPSAMHAEFACRAMRAGKHVLIEKPVDITPEAAEIIEKVRLETGMKAGVVHQNRNNSCMHLLKDAVNDGRLGKVFLGTFAVKWYRTQDYYNGWHGTWDMDGGGSLINQSVHTVDIMQWLMGDVESVTSTMDIVDHDIETEDMTATLIKFKSGAAGTFVTTTCAYPGICTAIELYGTGGTVELDGDVLKTWKMKEFSDEFAEKHGLDSFDTDEEENEIITKYGSNGAYTESFPGTHVGHQSVVDDMIAAVKDGRDPQIMPLEAIKSVKIVNAIYESARTGKTVYIG